MALSRGFSPAQFRDAFIGTFGPVTVTATIPSTATLTNSTVAVTVAGLQPNDMVFVLPQGSALVAGVQVDGICTAANTLSLVANNGSAGTYNPGSQSFIIMALRPKLA